jgi:hypothetical protein
LNNGALGQVGSEFLACPFCVSDEITKKIFQTDRQIQNVVNVARYEQNAPLNYSNYADEG